MTSTCFEPQYVSDLAASNARRLRQLGCEVLLSVDATDLGAKFSGLRFDRIVFMFPHVGKKMKIHKASAMMSKQTQFLPELLQESTIENPSHLRSRLSSQRAEPGTATEVRT